MPTPILNSHTRSDISQPVSDPLLYRAYRKVLTESMSLQELQPQDTGAFKAEEATGGADRQGSILSSSLPTLEAHTVSAETCCKCRCHQPATPTSPPTAPPTMHKVKEDWTSPISYSRSLTKPHVESPFQQAALGSEGWSSTEPGVEGALGGDTPTLEGEDEACDGGQGGGSETNKETGSDKQNKLGIDVPKQEGRSNELEQESKEPEENGSGVNGPQQEVEVNEVVKNTVPEQDGSMEKRSSGRSVEGSEAVHDPLPNINPPPPTDPTHHPASSPKERPPVLPTATPPLPDTPTTPFSDPLSGPTKEDDYSTVADALAFVGGERVLVCQRPSVAVTSPHSTQLPSQFRAPAIDDYCEVIFANNNEQSSRLEEAEAQGGQGVKRVRTLPRQVRQEKEEVVRVKERSFSLRGKLIHSQGHRPLDLLPTPSPMPVREEETLVEKLHHGATTEDVAIPTGGHQHVCSPTCRHGATFHIVDNPPIRSDQLLKSVFSPTSPTDGRGLPAVEGVGQRRPPPSTVYTMVNLKKKTRNRSEGEKDELDEPPMHFSVNASPGKSANSPSSPNKSLPSHIPISRNQSCPVKSPPSQVATRRAPQGDYEEVDIPKKGGVHATYEEVKPSRIPTPRRQNPSPTK